MLLTSRQIRWIAAVAFALLFLAPAPARADDPFRLSEQLTDRSDVLGDRRAEAAAALSDLRDQTRLQLFVVFVHSFDGTSAQDWADQTAQRSDLGDRDALLAVATRDRSYAYSFDNGYPLTDAQLEDVAATAIEPPLAQNDWAGAVIGAANGYRAVSQGQPVPAPRIVPGQPDTSADGGFPVAGVVLGVVAVAAAGTGGLVWWRHRRRQAAAGPAPGAVSIEELSARANTLLVQLDDELRTSERELTLATGQYGAEATRSFATALESARQEVAEAFRLRMELDDSTADNRAALTEIISRCEAADERLDAEADAFDALRELESHVEQSVAELGQRRTAAEARLPEAEATLANLTGQYAAAALATVAGNVTQARERLEFAGTALARAGESVTQGQRSQAALVVRGAEEALTQADTLLTAISTVDAQLAAARSTADTLLAEVEAELAEARSAQAASGVAAQATPSVGPAAGSAVGVRIGETAAGGVGEPEHAPTLSAAAAQAEQAVTAVRAMLAQPKPDPLAAVRQLQEADAALDRALAGFRDAQQQISRARAQLDRALPIARAEVATAGAYVSTRRGAVASQARTWLAEAQRRLARAEQLAATDPVAALAEAHQATQWAAHAGRAAQADVEAWAPPGGGFAGAGVGGSWGGAGGGGFVGALLGGILASGGSGHRRSHYGGWGGNSFGGSRSRSGGGGRRGGGGRF